MRRVESACAARASAARRLPAPRTRSALLASFPTRRFVEADFAASVGRISPPRTGEQSFRRLTHAADTRVEAADDLNDAVVRRDVPEARAALSVSRSASIVIEREARALGARCAS